MTKSIIYHFLVIVLITFLPLTKTKAQKAAFSSYTQSKTFAFEENKGQLADPSGKVLKDIAYYGSQPGLNVYCMPARICFVFTKANMVPSKSIKARDKSSQISDSITSLSATRTEMEFIGANPKAKIIAEQKLAHSKNYYLPHTGEQGLNDVSSFAKLTYSNIYDHIDLVLLAKEQGIEYEFVVHPGGKAESIQIKWNGTKEIKETVNGGIQYINDLGNITESNLQCFSGGKALSSQFVRNDNIVSFKVENNDKTQDLVIDPYIKWSTYYGGGNPESTGGIATDKLGNVFVTGSTLSSNGIATNGAFQTNSNSAIANAYLAKFNSKGSLLWATYFGGNIIDSAKAIAVDNDGNICIVGYGKGNGITSSGAYQTSSGGNYDAFIAKFDTKGNLIWATLYGGQNNDGAFAVVTDQLNNIYVTGLTYSTNAIATTGAFKTGYSGSSDVFITKFDKSGSLQWGTYFGGNGIDFGYGIATDSLNNIYVTGLTTSGSNIASTGAYQTSLGGGRDVFLLKLNSSGKKLWGTYFGGQGDDGAFGIATDKSGNCYLTGYTKSNSGMASLNAYQNYKGGYTDALLAKFDNSGARVWSTYYGGSSYNCSFAVSIDDSDYVYIGGLTYSKNNIITSGAYQTSNNINANGAAFMSKFTKKGALSWGSYFGALNDSDESACLATATDLMGNVYFSGVTQSKRDIATYNAHQTTFGGGYYDNFIIKFSRCYTSEAITGKASSCKNDILSYKALRHPGSSYHWDVKGGTILSGQNKDSISVIWTRMGSDSIIMYESNPNYCTDTLYTLVKVYPQPVAHWKPSLIGNGYFLFKSKDSIYKPSQYQWSFGDGSNSSGYSIKHKYKKDSLYHIQLSVIDTNGCITVFDSTLRVIITGIAANNALANDVSVYPNPFTDKFTVSFTILQASPVVITEYDILGRMIARQESSLKDPGKHSFEFNGNGPGTYIIKVAIGNNQYIQKVIRSKY